MTRTQKIKDDPAVIRFIVDAKLKDEFQSICGEKHITMTEVLEKYVKDYVMKERRRAIANEILKKL